MIYRTGLTAFKEVYSDIKNHTPPFVGLFTEVIIDTSFTMAACFDFEKDSLSSSLDERNPFDEASNLPYACKGCFEQAKTTAQNEAKYLVVCFYSGFHEATDSLFSDVLKTDAIAAQFLERCIFFLACVDTEEGNYLSSKYAVQTYPSLIFFFKDEIALELSGRLTLQIVLKEWEKCTLVWDAIVAEELVFISEKESRLREFAETEKRLLEIEKEDLKRLQEFEKEVGERERRQEEKKRVKRERCDEKVALALALEKEQTAVRRKESQIAFAKEEALRLLNPEPELKTERDLEGEADRTEKSKENAAVIHLRFRFRTGEVRNRRFLREDFADQLLYYVRTVDDAYCLGTVEFVLGFSRVPLTWDTRVTTLGSLEQLSSNIVINVRTKVER